jgi:hypothetical protein
MSDNMLKREFNTRDVQRMRNIITKDYSAKTGTQIGYTKENTERKEGDVWEENGKQWTIKNGIKMTVTKLDKIKQLIQTPLTCPNCHKPMVKGKIDKYMYSIHKKCSDCVFEYETKLKREGKFEEYQRNIMNSNKDAYLDDIINAIDTWAEVKETFVNEAGDVENWAGGNVDKEEIARLKDHIKKLKEQQI